VPRTLHCVFVFEDKRYQYDTHGNLIEKKIGRHTIIALDWDVEHQLKTSTVTKNAADPDPKKRIVQVTQYRYDAFGRRIGKETLDNNSGCLTVTDFLWDGNRLLAETRAARTTAYLYEPDSFAPLAQIEFASTTASVTELSAKAADPTGDEEQDDADVNIRALQHAALASALAAHKIAAYPRAIQTAANDSVNTSSTNNTNTTNTTNTTNNATRNDNGNDRNRERTVPPKAFTIRYYQNDQIGTPRELTDEHGKIKWAATYKTWGTVETEFVDDGVDETFFDGNTIKRVAKKNTKPMAQASAASRGEVHQPLRFQGQYFDEETGLHYNRFRYYDPDVGRFVSQDPIGFGGGDNFYRYAPNPATWLDPFGLNLFCKTSWQAPGRGTGHKYDVFQQNIDWNLSHDGKTNLQRAAEGGSPYVIKDGITQQLNLHHSRQHAQGPLFEVTTSTHRAVTGHGREALHPYGQNQHPDYPVNRKEFDVDRKQYWKDRAEAEKRRRAGGC
jgi:RHS repeat-associated protein